MSRAMRFAAAALLCAPAGLAAQLPDAATRALGMAGVGTAMARGYDAVFWNPALLATRGQPGVSIGLPHGLIEFGSNAYGFGDFRKYSEEVLTDADKQYLLDQVDSTLDLRTFGAVTPLALQIGNFALSFGTAGDIHAALGKDAVELALFGNASRSGPGQFFTAAGSNGRGWAATTLAASFAMPLVRTPFGRISAGITGKKIWGHAVGMGRETSSQFAVNPTFTATAAGHAIYTDYDDDFEANGIGDLLGGEGSPGSGFGLDLGGALELSHGLTVGLTLVNVLGSMSWDESRFRYDRVSYQVTQLASGAVNDTLIQDSLIGASAIQADAVARALRDTLLAEADFSRLVRAGASWRMGSFNVGADVQLRLTKGLDRHPAQYVAVGGEYVLLGFLPLRAGIGTDFGTSLTLSAGSGLHLGPVKIDASIAHSSGSARPGVKVGAGIGLMF